LRPGGISARLDDREQGGLQPLGVLAAQWREEALLGLLRRLACLVQPAVARPGEFHDVPAPVPGVRAPPHQSLVLQHVDQVHHRGPVHTEPLRSLLLRRGLAAGQHGEHRQFPPGQPKRLERGRGQCGQPELGVLEQVSQAPG